MPPTLRVLKIWKEHLYDRGTHTGIVGEALPEWSPVRNGYDVYESGNKLERAEVASTLDEVWTKLGEGFGVRCIDPTTGYKSILKGGFKAVVQMP